MILLTSKQARPGSRTSTPVTSSATAAAFLFPATTAYSGARMRVGRMRLSSEPVSLSLASRQ